MKRLFVLLAVVAWVFALTGCGGDDGYNPSRAGKEQAKSILNCFDEDDSDSLKAMFCERVVNSHNLDAEITKAMEFFDGKTVSHRSVQVGGGESVDDGELTDGHIWYSIWEIKTDAKRHYRIVTHSFLVYKRDPRCVGITYLKVIDEETDEIIQIGEYVY